MGGVPSEDTTVALQKDLTECWLWIELPKIPKLQFRKIFTSKAVPVS